jgi:MoaA/NifB/PqqE/SkfB family radical SAM enzyme
MYDLTKPIDINWELNNICNLMCPQCGRNEIKDGVLQWNKNGSGNPTNNLNDRDTSLEDFKTAFDNIGNVGTVRFYGHVSENVASRDFAKICEFIIDKGSNVMVSTNGSLRSKYWWSKLGEIYKGHKKSKVAFCLDGLREELSLYRINASYNKIIENAKSFIDAGGRAEWRMIVFKHNQHQIEEAKQIAKECGFHNFTLILSNRKENWGEPFTYKNKTYNLLPQDIDKTWSKKEQQRIEYINSDKLEEISCKFEIQNSIYIDHLLKVWACCYIPNRKNLLGEHKYYDDYYHDTSNNLLEKSLNDILNDKFYDILPIGWELKSTCLSPCKSTCTKKHNSGNPRSSNYRENVW